MSHVPKAFCFCGGEMKNQETGVNVDVSLPDQDDALYYKISCDLYTCVDCDSAIFLTAPQPLAYPHDPNYSIISAPYVARIRG